ncbi:hypothetical protein [Streptomyces sp. DH24]|uniref:hypothetical protein n=1 Tax=Streptomyces sp. DH24 TaxID=3040123 RepID=UPI002440EEF1|nr:hypothetical protein [Streptomyces sp. DH24]MDG9715887.1 hypothetical protein [Streptomyces sp. DH24]
MRTPSGRFLGPLLAAALITVAGCGGGPSGPGGPDGTTKPAPSAPSSPPRTTGPSPSPSGPSPRPTGTSVASPVGSWSLTSSGSGYGFYVLTVRKNGKISTLGRPGGGTAGGGTDICFGNLTGRPPSAYKVRIKCVNTAELKPGRPKTDVFEGRAALLRNPFDGKDTLSIVWKDGTRDRLTKMASDA